MSSARQLQSARVSATGGRLRSASAVEMARPESPVGPVPSYTRASVAANRASGAKA